jgi:hypothetical protein
MVWVEQVIFDTRAEIQLLVNTAFTGAAVWRPGPTLVTGRATHPNLPPTQNVPSASRLYVGGYA